MVSEAVVQQIQFWSIDKLVFYARNHRKNDAAVDRTCASIREFGFECPALARSERDRGGWAPQNQGRAEAGIVARWRHDRNPSNPMRRVDAGPSESLSPDGEPLSRMGRLG